MSDENLIYENRPFKSRRPRHSLHNDIFRICYKTAPRADGHVWKNDLRAHRPPIRAGTHARPVVSANETDIRECIKKHVITKLNIFQNKSDYNGQYQSFPVDCQQVGVASLNKPEL